MFRILVGFWVWEWGFSGAKVNYTVATGPKVETTWSTV